MKDRVPPEIREVRKKRKNRRKWTALGFWLAWAVLFSIGVQIHSDMLAWLSWIFLSCELAVQYELRERALRRIAGRPAPDYKAIRKMQKKLSQPQQELEEGENDTHDQL